MITVYLYAKSVSCRSPVVMHLHTYCTTIYTPKSVLARSNLAAKPGCNVKAWLVLCTCIGVSWPMYSVAYCRVPYILRTRVGQKRALWMHGLCCWFFVYPVGSEHCKLCCVYSGRYFVWSHLNSYGIVSHTWCVNLFSPKSVLARSKLIAKRGGALCMHGFCDSETESPRLW